MEEIGRLETTITKGKTKSFEEFLLTEDQFLFLGSLMRNNPQVVEFKLRLVKEFSKCRKQLEKALGQKGDPRYDQARLTA
jgi:phage regulator Rha-like protein